MCHTPSIFCHANTAWTCQPLSSPCLLPTGRLPTAPRLPLPRMRRTTPACYWTVRALFSHVLFPQAWWRCHAWRAARMVGLHRYAARTVARTATLPACRSCWADATARQILPLPTGHCLNGRRMARCPFGERYCGRDRLYHKHTGEKRHLPAAVAWLFGTCNIICV